MKVTEDLLNSLGCGDTPIITVLNKCDLIESDVIEQQFESGIKISAKTGDGIDELLNAIEQSLPMRFKTVNLLIPFANAGLLNEIRQKAILNSEEYVAEGIKAVAVVDEEIYSKVKEFEEK